MGIKTGFALLTKEQQKEMAGIGGRAAQAKGTARRWTAEEAALAGRKGGLARARRNDSTNREGTS